MNPKHDVAIPATDHFLRRMLWRVADQPKPLVALLGPRGSGRSKALTAMSHACRGTVVHASIDFGLPDDECGDKPLDPAAAVAVIASEMSRSWTNLRYDPTFHRVGLCLLAMNENLDTGRPAARTQIESLIKEYVRTTRRGLRAARIERGTDHAMTVATMVASLNAKAAGKVVDSVHEPVRQLVGALLRRLARRELSAALAWHTNHADAEATHFIDRLIKINRTDRHQRLYYLVQAMLADIQDNVTKIRPMRSQCRCLVPAEHAGGTHHHAWLLLVDNADTDQGQQFLAALARAKAELVRGIADRTASADPLLVVAAVDRWRPEWDPAWIEPWVHNPPEGGRPRRVPILSKATDESWLPPDRDMGHMDRDGFGFWLPVWLDAFTTASTTTLVGARSRGVDDPGLGRFVQRLTAGYPAAVEQIRLNALTAPDGFTAVRGKLLVHHDGDTLPLWARAIGPALRDIMTVDEPPWDDLPGVLVAAGYFSDPWRPDDKHLPSRFPTLPTAVARLQESLWISTFAARPSPLWSIARGDVDRPATLHSWLMWCLLAGADTLSMPRGGPEPPETPESPGSPKLPGSPGSPESVWDHLFHRLRCAVAPDRTDRSLFYDLALGDFASVVGALAERFDTVEHREWVRLLDDVTAAPCRTLITYTPEAAYHTLISSIPQPCSALQMATARLVAALWLRRSPFIVEPRRWDKEIRDGFLHLKLSTTRGERTALSEAERRFDPEVSTAWD